METEKKPQNQGLTGWHYLAALLGFLAVGMIFYWERTDKHTAKQGQIECDEKLLQSQENYIRLYDSMMVWKPIVKNSRKAK